MGTHHVFMGDFGCLGNGSSTMNEDVFPPENWGIFQCCVNLCMLYTPMGSWLTETENGFMEPSSEVMKDTRKNQRM